MPFTGNTYSLPAGSIVANGTKSNAETQHNVPLNDIAAALTLVKGSVSTVALSLYNTPISSPAGVTPGALMYIDGATYQPELDDVLAPQRPTFLRDIQHAGIYYRMPSIVGNDLVSPADARELGDYWMRVCMVPGWASHPEDIYPDMGIGWGAAYPLLGGRSMAIGYFAGSNTTYVDTLDNEILVGTGLGQADPVKYAGLTYLPIPWGVFLGERSGRQSRDSSPTFIGQQSGLGSRGFNTVAIGRFAYWGADGYFNTVVANNAGRSMQGARNLGFGDSALSFSTVDYCVGMGQRSLAYAVALNTITSGYESGAYAAIDRSVLLGYRSGYKLDGLGNVLIGDSPVSGGSDAAKARSCSAPLIDIVNSRFRLPAGTFALWGVSNGDNVSISFDPTGMTRPPQDWEDLTAFIGVAVLDGGNEYVKTWTTAVDIESSKRAARMAWPASGGSDRNPNNYEATTVWALSTSYDVRWPIGETVAHDPTDVVTHGGFVWFCILPHVSAATSEPGVGATWATYWERTDPEGTYTLTPNKRVENSVGIGRAVAVAADNAVAIGYNSSATANEATAVGKGADATAAYATAIGREAQSTHTNSTAIGRGATSTQANEVTFGDASVTKLSLAGKSVPFITEVGTWTPSFGGTTTDPTFPAYTTQIGTYEVWDLGHTKICKFHIHITVGASTVAGTGNLVIKTMPKTMKATKDARGRAGWVTGFAGNGTSPRSWLISSSSAIMNLYRDNSATGDTRAGVLCPASDISATVSQIIVIDGEYETT